MSYRCDRCGKFVGQYNYTEIGTSRHYHCDACAPDPNARARRLYRADRKAYYDRIVDAPVDNVWRTILNNEQL